MPQVVDNATFHQEMEANSRWNFAVNLVDVTFFMFAVNLVSRATIMPLLVSELTASKVAVGLIAAVWSLGFYLPQLLTANFTEGLRYKKPFVLLVGGLVERLPFLLIGLALLLLAEAGPVVALMAFFVLLGTSATGSGTATPAWLDLIAKMIPVHRRGLWFGLGASLGAVLGIAGAALAGRILDTWRFPQNFALCFFIAFGAVAISWGGLALSREPASQNIKPRVGFGHYLKQLPNVMRQDTNYIRFLISRSIANLGGMAVGFLIVYGTERFDLDGTQVGALTAILVGSQAVMNLLWGIVADRRGHKIVLCGVSAALALTVAVAWAAPSAAWLWLTFALLGAAMAGDRVSSLTIVLEFCAPEDRPTYIGLTNTLFAPVLVFAPILGGWLATWTGYGGMFLMAFLTSSLGGALLALWVHEPRHQRQEQALATV